MTTDITFQPGSDGRDSTATIRIEGVHDIFRFAVNMLHQQVEFCRAGRVVLVELREHLTPERFDPMARSLLGEDRYERLHPYFERDQYCAACERGFELGEKVTPIADAKALCRECTPPGLDGHRCPYTHAHTRDFCGYATCREA